MSSVYSFCYTKTMIKILIVEDEKDLREMLVKRVTKLGYESAIAVDGVDALKKFHAFSPDLMLLDIIMPKKNGFEVLEEIRIKEKSRVPVIILSNLNQDEDIKMAKTLHVYDYIVKSNISLAELSLKIHNALQSDVS